MKAVFSARGGDVGGVRGRDGGDEDVLFRAVRVRRTGGMSSGGKCDVQVEG